jgi:hypothetical protein
LGQDRRDPGGEFIERERLSQNFHAVRQVGVVERSPGVAGDEQNPQAWRRRTGGVRELPPAQARKPDVGDQKILMAPLIDKAQSFNAVNGFDDFASHVGEDFDDLGAHVGLVFNHQNDSAG